MNKKKILTLILCVISLVSFMSCGKPAEEFVVPAKTNELVIYHSLDPYVRAHFDTAVKLFKDMYPYVEVRVEETNLMFTAVPGATEDHMAATVDSANQGMEAYRNRLRTELMAGPGPDIVLFSEVGGDFGDVRKTMNLDVFEDLNPYFSADKTFTYDDFVGSVFDAGVRDGRRLFVPINYDVPIRFTSLEGLDAWDIELPEKMNREQYEMVLQRVYKQIETGNDRSLSQFNNEIFSSLYNQSGLTYIDYEKGEVVIDSVQLKSFLDTFGPFDLLEKELAKKGLTSRGVSMEGYPSAILNGAIFELAFDDYYYGIDSLGIEYCRFVYNEGQTPIFHGVPNASGEESVAYVGTCVAIGKNSENKVNAYEFLRILLSDDAYVHEDNSKSPIPVRKQSAERFLKEQVVNFEEIGDEYIQKCLRVIGDVEIVYRSPDVIKIVEEIMIPYVKGVRTYEECFEELENKLTLYISE